MHDDDPRPERQPQWGERGPDGAGESPWRTWVSRGSIAICVGIFLATLVLGQGETWADVARFGFLPAERIYGGHYWALVSSAFVHFDAWHIVMNMLAFWALGPRLERSIGSWPMLGFIVVTAFVGSSAQLAATGTTGIGASGVLYAMFGFMWVTRDGCYPEFGEIITPRNIQIAMGWLVACVVLTHLEVLHIANAAHAGGLAAGAVIGCVPLLRRRFPLIYAAPVLLIALAVLPLFWAPWSVDWLSHRALTAHRADQFQAALGLYDQIIARDPDNAWAYRNRASCHANLGNAEAAERDFERAISLDPDMAAAD